LEGTGEEKSSRFPSLRVLLLLSVMLLWMVLLREMLVLLRVLELKMESCGEGRMTGERTGGDARRDAREGSRAA
jgi:hypothetical protein